MLATTLLTLATISIIPLTAAATAPICTPSNKGADVPYIKSKSKDFCNQLKATSFSQQTSTYGWPQISFSYEPLAGKDKCDLDSCLKGYESLIGSCQFDSHSLYGHASLPTTCGTFDITVSPPSLPSTSTSTSSSAAKPHTSTVGLRPSVPSLSSTSTSSPTVKPHPSTVSLRPSVVPRSSSGPEQNTTTNTKGKTGAANGRVMGMSGVLLGVLAGVFVLFL